MPTTFSARRLLCFALLSLLLVGSVPAVFAQNPVEINVCDNTYISGDQLRVPVTVAGFTDILSVQFSVDYGADQLQLVGIVFPDSTLLPGISQNSFGTTTPGKVAFSWFDPTSNLVSLPDATVLFELVFLQIGPGPYALTLADDPTPVEVYGVNQTLLPVEGCQGQVVLGSNVFITTRFDANGDCNPQAEETGLPNWQLTLSDGSDEYIGYANELGLVVMSVPPGTYSANWTAPASAELWAVCPGSETVVVPASGILESAVSIGAAVECPQLRVSVSSGNFRPCFENNLLLIEYANLGSATATDAYIELNLNTAITILDSPVAYTEVEPGLIRFELGDVPVGATERWYLTARLDCDFTVGATLCFTGQIFPNAPCEGFDPAWAGGDVKIATDCSGGEAKFLIRNEGTGPADNLQYIVIEDAVMYSPQPVSVPVGGEVPVTMPANGATFRLEMDQPVGHPDLSRPLAVLEGCGTNGSGTFSTGFVNAFPQYDADDYFDRYCVQVTAAYDPNDKMAVPFGIDAERFIEPNGRLDYRIRFQNTGTDTAFTVIIKDTLPPGLDVSTLRAGAASHPYELTITEERILSFSFRNILLPDSTTNEPASNGFVLFSIAQDPELPDGTRLENSASIYFDFNPPIVTNLSVHTVMRDFLEVVSGTPAPGAELPHRVFPNPVADELHIQLGDFASRAWGFTLYDALGRPVRHQLLNAPENHFSVRGLAAGVYYYRLSEPGGRWTSGRLSVR
jgi:uncharacterized repeat protein (TIGR01451 family)